MSIEILHNDIKCIINRIPYYISIRKVYSPILNYSERLCYFSSFEKQKTERKLTLFYTPIKTERRLIIDKIFSNLSSSRLCYTPKGILPSNERKIYFLVNNEKITYTFTAYLTFTYESEKKIYVETNERRTQRKCCYISSIYDYRFIYVQRFTHLETYTFKSELSLKKENERKVYIETYDRITQRRIFVNTLRYDYRLIYLQTNKFIPIYTFETQLRLIDTTERKITYKVDIPNSERLICFETPLKYSERKIVVPLSLFNERKLLVERVNDKNLYEFKTIFAILKYSERKLITKGFIYKTERKLFVYSTPFARFYRKQRLNSYKLNNIGSDYIKTGNIHFTLPNYSIVNIEFENEDSPKTQLTKRIYRQIKDVNVLNLEVVIDNENVINKPILRGKSSFVDVSRNTGYTINKEKIERRLWKSYFKLSYAKMETSMRKCVITIGK